MEAKITFNLDEPDDIEKYQLMMMNDDFHNVVWELAHNFHRQFKYLEDKDITYDLLVEKINELLTDINIDKL